MEGEVSPYLCKTNKQKNNRKNGCTWSDGVLLLLGVDCKLFARLQHDIRFWQISNSLLKCTQVMSLAQNFSCWIITTVPQIILVEAFRPVTLCIDLSNSCIGAVRG